MDTDRPWGRPETGPETWPGGSLDADGQADAGIDDDEPENGERVGAPVHSGAVAAGPLGVGEMATGGLDADGEVDAGVEDDEPETGAVDGGALDIEVLDAIEKELADVEIALERLGEGSYGRCQSCDQVLTDEELETSPAGRFCPTHRPVHSSRPL
jgi:DnaK suppressor protein